MIDQAAIRNLIKFDAGDARVLSVYLNLQPDRQRRRAYRIVFKDLVKELKEGLDKQQQLALECESSRVGEFLTNHYPPGGKGLVVFTCTPHDLWHTMFLPVVVADLADFSRHPYIRPLLDVLDEYERYAIVLVSKDKARLFTVYLGQIEEQKRVSDYVPPKHDRGGVSQANFQRHLETHVLWHLKKVTNELSELMQSRPFDRLILAGPAEVTAELERLLPKTLRNRLIARVPGEISASEAEILQASLEIERDAERRAEETTVTSLLETAFAGGKAILGLDATLEAICLGRVQKLVVSEDLRAPGVECSVCGWLMTEQPSDCPACGGEPILLDDIVERACERTLEEKGTVEIVHESAASRLSEAGGGIGALLRF